IQDGGHLRGGVRGRHALLLLLLRPGRRAMSDERYVLATGAEAAHRLRVVNSVHGADTEAFLRRGGPKARMRVGGLGCGGGVLSCWMAQQGAEVVGVDVSAGQVEQARLAAQQEGRANAQFVRASAYETGLESEAFDLVFSRFLLMHVQRPAEALTEMRRLL